MTTPTPEEAQRTLDEIAEVRRETTAAASSSRWWYLGCGILCAGLGVLNDQAPNFTGRWGSAIVLLLLLAVLARGSRWGAPLFGRRVSPRLPGNLALRLGMGVLGAIVSIVLTFTAFSLHMPHLYLWTGIGGGLLIALAGPWWQARVLRRGARL